MEKKNIIYIGGFELPDKNAAAQRVIANGKLLSIMGYNVIYIGVDKNDTFLEGNTSLLNVDGFIFKSKPKKYPKTKFEWLKYLTNISFIQNTIVNDYNGNVDLIIAYNYPAYALYRIMELGKKLNIKVIADVTEWYNSERFSIYGFIKGIDTYFRMRIVHKQLSGIITISKFLENYYKNSKTIFLPPLIDKNANKWNPIELINNDLIKLIYVGSPGDGGKDRLDLIIKMLSDLKDLVNDFELSIIGINKEQYSYLFRDTVPDNIKDDIIFKGRLSHFKAISEIKKSDFTIFFRKQNLVNSAGFPTKFVESISCGIPVITNETSNLKMFYKKSPIGFIFKTDDYNNIKDSLKVVLQKDRVVIDVLKKNCLKYKEFDIHNYKDNFTYFINSLN